MSITRVHQLAKELGVESKDIVEKCRAEEIPRIKDYRSTVTEGLAQTIREWFSPYQTAAPAPESQPVSRNSIGVTNRSTRRRASLARTKDSWAESNSRTESALEAINLSDRLFNAEKVSAAESEPIWVYDAIRESEHYFDEVNPRIGIGAADFSVAFLHLWKNLERAAIELLRKLVASAMPANARSRWQFFFQHPTAAANPLPTKQLRDVADRLFDLSKSHGRKNFPPVVLLRDCFNLAINSKSKPAGIFETLRNILNFDGATPILRNLNSIIKFRNEYVGHGEEHLKDMRLARENLDIWKETLLSIIRLTASK